MLLNPVVKCDGVVIWSSLGALTEANVEVLEVALEIPGDLGAEALANSKVNDVLRAHGIHAKWDHATSEGVERMSSYHDFGATLLVVAGTAVAGKAVAGIFEVLKVIIQETHAINRQREQQEHERIVLCLKLGALKYDLDLDRPLGDLEAKLTDVAAGA